MATKSEKRQAMFSIIESWKISGQSQQDFCKTQGLAYSGFHYWYKKYRQHQKDDGSPSFLPVQIKGIPTGLVVAELIFPDLEEDRQLPMPDHENIRGKNYYQ